MNLKTKSEAVMLSDKLNTAGIKLPANVKLEVSLKEDEFNEFIKEALPMISEDKHLKRSIMRQNGIEMTVNGVWFHFKINQ